MPNLPLTLQTKVGRRMLALFVGCALVPILVIAALGYTQVRGQLIAQAREQLQQSAKAVGMGIFDQLRGARASFAEVQAAEGRQREYTLSGPFAERARSMFGAVVVERPGRPRTALWGPDLPLPALDSSSSAALAAGRIVLETLRSGDTTSTWLLGSLPGGGRIAGTVRGEHLFGGAGERALIGRAQAFVCVRAGALPLACELPDAARASLQESWELFLGYDFGARAWRIDVAQYTADALAPLLAFRRVFLATIVLALGVVVAVSTRQVRRSLLPLQELGEGTTRLAQRDFSRPVVVTSHDEFEDLARSFNAMAGDLDRQFKDNSVLIDRLGQLSYGALAALARTIDASSPWTAGHSERVTAVSLRMAERLGLPEEDRDTLRRGGLLHDIGKIGIPPHILDKPGILDPDELARIREHPVLGARILAPLEAFADAVPIVRSHHERFDGRGYPQGLAGSDIPYLARLLSVADVYDALVSSRPYRPGWPRDLALESIRDASGTQFDPRMIEVFFAVMETEGDAARFSLTFHSAA